MGEGKIETAEGLPIGSGEKRRGGGVGAGEAVDVEPGVARLAEAEASANCISLGASFVF